MATTPRQRVVDDTDPSIQYGANGWFVVPPETLGGVGNFGPIFNESSHATTSSDSSLSFAFNGTSLNVVGTIMVSTDTNNVTDPTWDCFVDKIKIPKPNPTFKFPENNWALCSQPTIAPGAHELTVQVQSKGKTFYLDYLVYTPMPEDVFADSVMIYRNTDPAVSFGSGWGTFGGENGTQTAGAQVALNFHGTRVSMYGFVPTELPHNATWGTWSIDGGSPQNFTLIGLDRPKSATSYNRIFFTTPLLSPTPHNLVVTYGGDSAHTPLTVQGFYVTNTTSLADASTTGSTPARSSYASSPSTSVLPPQHLNTGPIVGGVIGALILILVILGALFLWQRKRRRRTADETAANPYPMDAADGAAPASGAGSAYVYSPVPGQSQRHGTSSGSRSHPDTDSRPSTTYPYVHRMAPSHTNPSDTTNSRSQTHMHQLSGTSGSAAPGPQTAGAVSAVLAHGSTRTTGMLAPDATPAPSHIIPPSKLSRERELPLPTTRGAGESVPADAVVVRHEDSGVRMREPEIVELPPGYSPD
ncbi:hypothetical protein C8R43DRAFT_1042049 [Mycena crocata]|nr:hypothetical protein C8R43DRAFT_1042049 [Mycena crocata]